MPPCSSVFAADRQFERSFRAPAAVACFRADICDRQFHLRDRRYLLDAVRRPYPRGISGASFSTCSAYIADISNDENRAKNFGLIGMAFGVGFVLGPVIGGFLGEFGPRVPFYGAAALAFLNFVGAYFLLPETLDAKHRRPFEIARANPFGALRQMRRYQGIGWVCVVMS